MALRCLANVQIEHLQRICDASIAPKCRAPCRLHPYRGTVRRSFSVAAAAGRDAANVEEDVSHPLPDCFSLERAILLAGFAFEAYNDPKGGLLDTDGRGGSTAYFSPFVKECFAGVLEVTLLAATGLAAADVTGKSDPYVVASVGESAHRSGTRRFTLDPTWRETFKLYVRRPEEQALRLRVMDEDLFGGDDDLGVAAVPLAGVCGGGAPVRLTLPVEDAGAGRGGGEVTVELLYRPFNPFAPTAPAAVAAPGGLGGLGGLLASVAGGLLAASVGAADAVAAELRRGQWESELWAVQQSGDWSLLAADARPSSMPQEFEKVCFVSQGTTDTQAAVWRNLARRQLVVAFRGTEMAKARDVVTDARLMPRAFNVERAAGSGGFLRAAAEPHVHDGFLEAFDSVRARCLRAVDDAAAGGADGWHVFVTGHSLGGALATLFAAELAASRRRCVVTMYNYGSPRVGNGAFCKEYNALVPDSVRVVNGSDAVPTLPALLGYRHVAHGVRVSGAGSVGGEPPVKDSGEGGAPWAGLLGGVVDERQAAEAAEALASLSDGASLEAHFEDKYLAALRVCVERANVKVKLGGERRGE